VRAARAGTRSAIRTGIPLIVRGVPGLGAPSTTVGACEGPGRSAERPCWTLSPRYLAFYGAISAAKDHAADADDAPLALLPGLPDESIYAAPSNGRDASALSHCLTRSARSC
jgi:hypothetical protein